MVESRTPRTRSRGLAELVRGLIVGFVILALGCPASPDHLWSDAELAVAPDPNVPAVDAAWADWVRKHNEPVRSLISQDFSDLQFLKPLLAGKRVVQLGESGHGMAEFSQLKVRLVKFLHQEMGFDVVAFESSPYQCAEADRFADVAEPMDTLMDCLFGVWHTQEVLPLFEHIRQTRDGERPLRFAGFDIQPIGRNKRTRPAFLRDVVAVADPPYAHDIYELDQYFLKKYGAKGMKRQEFLRNEGARLALAYDRLSTFLLKNRKSLSGRFEQGGNPRVPLVAMQTARFMARYLRHKAEPDPGRAAEIRDRSMADNVRFLIEQLYPDKKVVLWAHNFHVRHDNVSVETHPDVFPGVPVRTMGSWLAGHLGDELYTIGFYAYRGQAASNSRRIFDLAAAQPGSLEALLHRVGSRALFVDFSGQERTAGSEWIFSTLTAKYNGTHDLAMVMQEQYDGVVFLDTVSPPDYLY